MTTHAISSCRCSSTSLHALPFSLRRSLSTRSRPTPHVQRRSPIEPAPGKEGLNYTAPLWEPRAGTGTTRNFLPWFNARQPSWDRCLHQSRFVASLAPPFSSPPSTSSPLFDLPPTKSTSRAPSALSYKKHLALLKFYLTLRSSSSAPPDSFLESIETPQKLLGVARDMQLPLVVRSLLRDLKKLKLRESEGARSEDAIGSFRVQEVRPIVGKGLGELGATPTFEEPPPPPLVSKPPPRKRRTDASELLKWVDARSTLLEIMNPPSAGQGDDPRSYPLPDALLAETPLLPTHKRLELLWKTYTSTPTLPDDQENFTLSLNFLHYLVAPSPSLSPSPSSPTPPLPLLPLSLKVLQHLLSTTPVPPEAVSPTPSPQENVPRPVALQLVILRTLTYVATKEGLFPLVKKALESLGVLRGQWYDKASARKKGEMEEDVDLELLQDAIGAVTASLEEERAKIYAPRAEVKDHPLLLAHQLVTSMLPAWSMASRVKEGVILERNSAVLDSFVKEAAARGRFDLVASVWELWGQGSTTSIARVGNWVIKENRMNLLRWYAGEGAFATYPTWNDDVAADNRGGRRRSIKMVQTRQYEELAAASFLAFRKGDGGIDALTIEEKRGFINLLCSSRASNSRTRDLARRSYTLFRAGIARGVDRGQFVADASTTLTLVRISVPPLSSSLSHTTFASSVITDLITSLTSPLSSYSSLSLPDHLSHTHLSTLAQCYSMLGDFDSTYQVYRKLLEQRMIPDFRDVQIILGNAARKEPRFAFTFIEYSVRGGIKLDIQTYAGVLVEVLVHHQIGGTEPGDDLQRLLGLITRLQVDPETINAVRLLIKHAISPSLFSHTRPSLHSTLKGSHHEPHLPLLLRLLSSARTLRQPHTAIILYTYALESHLYSEPLLQSALSVILAPDTRSSRLIAPDRPVVNKALRKFIDHALFAKPPLISRRLTRRLVLKAARKVGDAEAFWKVLERVEEKGLGEEGEGEEGQGEGDGGEQRRMMRWAVEKFGREEVLRRGGWLARGLVDRSEIPVREKETEDEGEEKLLEEGEDIVVKPQREEEK